MTLGAKTDRMFAAEADARQAAGETDSRLEIDRLMDQYGNSLLRMSALYLKDADLGGTPCRRPLSRHTGI